MLLVRRLTTAKELRNTKIKYFLEVSVKYLFAQIRIIIKKQSMDGIKNRINAKSSG